MSSISGQDWEKHLAKQQKKKLHTYNIIESPWALKH